jgi:hypothetical protein
MFDVVKLYEKLKAGTATLLLVKGEHPEGELPTIWIHPVCKVFCQETGKPSEKREVFNLADFAHAARRAQENFERAKAEAEAWKEILSSAVKAKREGDFSKDLKDKDVRAVIEAAQKAA